MDGPDPGGGDDDTPDEAAAAFEALRREVHELRRFATAAVQQRPDYTPTLAAMAATLAKIEGHPALKLTPQAHAQQLRAAQDGAQRQGEQALVSATGRVGAAAGDLVQTLDQARTADQQKRRVLQVGGGGWCSARCCGWRCRDRWCGRSRRAGPCRRRWRRPPCTRNRATAGQHRIASVNAAAWAESLGAVRLFRANREAVAACGRKVQTSGATVRCTISVAPGG